MNDALGVVALLAVLERILERRDVEWHIALFAAMQLAAALLWAGIVVCIDVPATILRLWKGGG